MWYEWVRQAPKAALLFWLCMIFTAIAEMIFITVFPLSTCFHSWSEAFFVFIGMAIAIPACGVICVLGYFLINVVWCLISPIAGICRRLDEDKK
jgi:hypothetical protein